MISRSSRLGCGGGRRGGRGEGLHVEEVVVVVVVVEDEDEETGGVGATAGLDGRTVFSGVNHAKKFDGLFSSVLAWRSIFKRRCSTFFK